MHVGMIGLGRTGANLVRRLMRAGHKCVIAHRTRPRLTWLMVSAAAVDRAPEQAANA
jgi:6-phosphogluconate dehydrogenase